MSISGKIVTLTQYAKYYSLYAIFKVIRIRKNGILFISMSGNSFGGNPKALSDYLKANYNNVPRAWAFSRTGYRDFGNQVNSVVLYSWAYYAALLKANVIISDQRLWKTMLPHKCKNQKYVQLWHGTALKRIEADMPNLSFAYKKRGIWDSSLIDLFVSGSEYMTNLFKRSFWYKGPFLECGTPRNDVFFGCENQNIKKDVCQELCIPENSKIVLYTPTFRGGNALDAYNLDSAKFINALKKIIPGEWFFVSRLHPNVTSALSELDRKQLFSGSIDASKFSDIQKLMAAADILITDYSSTMFDFMYTKKPCFIYAIDIDSYDRGFYFDMKKDLPFPVAENMNELCNVLQNYNADEYKLCVEKFIKKIGSKESGHACETIIEYIGTNYGFN